MTVEFRIVGIIFERSQLCDGPVNVIFVDDPNEIDLVSVVEGRLELVLNPFFNEVVRKFLSQEAIRESAD